VAVVQSVSATGRVSRAIFAYAFPSGILSVAVGPARGIVLQEGHDYVAVLTNRVKDETGRAIGMSDDMKAVAAGTAPGAIGAIYNKAYATASATLKPLLSDGASIVAIAPYRTMQMSHELFAMRDALESAQPATLAWDAASMAPMGAVKFAAKVSGTLPAGFTASLDDWLGGPAPKLPAPENMDDPSSDLPVRAHDKIAAFGSAVFTAKSFLPEKPNGYPDPTHHVFVYDNGKVVEQAPVKIWVSFSVPAAPMPAAGYPTVIVQHGLSGSRAYLLDLANVFAAQGWLVAGIDSVTFGARASEPQFHVDQISAWQGSPGAVYKGPDGLADPVNQSGQPDLTNGATNGSFDCFGGLQNILAVRDQFRQAGYDTAQLVKLLRANPDLSPLDTGSGAPKIDPDHIVYVGDSLGAMEGTIAAAIEPHVKAWMLNVDGGSIFPDLAMHSPTIGLQVAAAAALNFALSGDRLDVYHPFTSVLQDIFEAGDPITYAPYLVTNPQPLQGQPTKPRNTLQVQALYDELVPNEANEAIARAGGWGLATPNVGSNAEVYDLTTAESNPRRTPLANVDPDGQNGIHDTPVAGVTAVLVQCSPCSHGEDMVDRNPQHDFLIPYFDSVGRPNYQRVSPANKFVEPFLGIQTAMTGFLADAIRDQVPHVKGFAVPVRDFDGDGYPDATDADPNDPTKH
jgi:hypothetical protein